MGPWAQAAYDYFYKSNRFVQENEILKDLLKNKEFQSLLWGCAIVSLSKRLIIKVLHIYPDVIQERRWKEESQNIFRSEAFWVRESFRILKIKRVIRKIQADIKMGKYRTKRDKYFTN